MLSPDLRVIPILIHFPPLTYTKYTISPTKQKRPLGPFCIGIVYIKFRNLCTVALMDMSELENHSVASYPAVLAEFPTAYSSESFLESVLDLEERRSSSFPEFVPD